MSSVATDEDIVDRWIEIDDSISVPEQTLEEILADKILNFDDELSGGEEEDDSLTLTARGSSQSSASTVSYTLDSPVKICQLESVSHQVRAQHEHKDGGPTSAIAASSKHIAVGTTRGFVLIFSRDTQRLEQSITSGGCPVSCLDFNGDGARLAIGYATGLVRIANTAAAKIIEETCEAVQPGRGVLQVTAVGSGRRVIVVDSGGSVYELHAPSRVRSRRVRCIFSGCHGEVVHVKTIWNGRILALLSLTKLFLISIPQAKLIFATSCVGPADRPPLIDWQFVDFKVTATEKVRNAVFCLARGNRVDLYRLADSFQETRSTNLIKTLTLNFEMINLKWVDPFHMLAIDPDERIHLVDTVRGEVLDLDLSCVDLVYGSSDFKGLSTGGNVSSALQFLSSAVCYQSVCRDVNVVFILGTSSVYTVSVSDQITQLEDFVERGDIFSAILFAIDIFTGKVVNKSNTPNLRHIVSSRLPSLIDQLLSFTTTGVEKGKVSRLIDHYKKHISLLVRTCVVTSRFDLLYNTIYPCLEKDSLSKTIFLEHLDDVLLDGLLENPPPSLVSDYLQHLVGEGHLSQFEAAVVRIPIDRQDIHYVMSTCRNNRLYDGIIYVYNKALMDYLGPLEEMFDNLASFVDLDVLSDCEVAQGNKLLLYLQCCLSGRAYSFGALPDPLAETVPLQTYRCLISLRGKDGNMSSETYPYLRLLLKFDAQQFFNVICTCSDSFLFSSADGRLQSLIEIVHKIVTSTKGNASVMAYLLAFIAHLQQRNAIVPSVAMISELIETVLLADVSEIRGTEAERCIVELMRNVDGLNESNILKLAKRLPHLQVCAYIYTNRRDFIKLVDCYLQDSLNAQSVFSVIRNLLGDLKDEELEKFSAYICSVLLDLSRVDAYQTAELLLDYFVDWLRGAAASSSADTDSAAVLFYNCFLVRRERGYRNLTGDEDLDERLFTLTVEDLVADEHDETRDEKLCERLRFWLPIGSRSDHCLNLAVSHNLLSSTVILLEARKLYDRAFELLYNELEKCWRKDEEKTLHFIDEIMRISSVHQVEARKDQWLLKVLLKLLTLPEPDLNDNVEMKLRLNDIIAGVVESGSDGAELLIDSLFEHPLFKHANYGKFRPLITSIFGSCRYERILLQATIKCIEDESLQRFADFIKKSTQRATGLVLSSECVICGQSPHKSSFLFSCGHSMHLECEPEGSAKQCPCRTSLFSSKELVSDNLLSVKETRRERLVCNIFGEDSLKLRLGPGLLRLDP